MSANLVFLFNLFILFLYNASFKSSFCFVMSWLDRGTVTERFCSVLWGGTQRNPNAPRFSSSEGRSGLRLLVPELSLKVALQFGSCNALLDETKCFFNVQAKTRKHHPNQRSSERAVWFCCVPGPVGPRCVVELQKPVVLDPNSSCKVKS